jgi:RNA methyltransferase, TrmH family
VITSGANPRLKLVRRLASRRQREKLGLFVCEGEDLVEAGLGAGLEPVDQLVAGENVAPEVLASVSTLAHPPRRLAVFRRAELPRLEPGKGPETGLALWRVGDPGNLGAILRAADGLGPAVVALSPGCADPTGPKALRASMGAIFRVPLAAFADAPGRRIALVAHGGEPLHDLDLSGPVTFVLGAEREGLPESVAATCEHRGSIGLQPGADSLNVALAAALALYERRRSVAAAGAARGRG